LAKGVGLALVTTLSGVKNEFSNGLTYLAIGNMIVCISIQMNYLNKALDTFNTSVVSPIYYVFFTTFVMIASGLLYGEFSYMAWYNILGLGCGFAIIITSVIILHLFKVQ
jgi:multidrug transporter EmrE-like cation transporter